MISDLQSGPSPEHFLIDCLLDARPQTEWTWMTNLFGEARPQTEWTWMSNLFGRAPFPPQTEWTWMSNLLLDSCYGFPVISAEQKRCSPEHFLIDCLLDSY